jgi:hypothetical protein
MPSRFDRGNVFTGAGVGTNAGVTVTIAAVTNKSHYVSDIDVSGDAAALVTIESPASTILWRKRYAAAFNGDRAFLEPIRGAVGQAVLLKISASTANCEANLQGRSV